MKYFGYKSFKTEVLAGVTSFLTMSYIIAVNPAILSNPATGMSFSGVLTATVLVSFFSTLLMGIVANLPFALAPGMGLNAFFTFTLIIGDQIPWQQALGLVFWSGVFFVLISVSPIRELIVKAIPNQLRLALSCGIGGFLIFIGLKNSHFIISNPATYISHAPVSTEMFLCFGGLILMFYLMRKKNPASFLIGISVITIISILFGKIPFPETLVSSPDFHSHIFKVDIWGSLKWAFVPSIITLIVTDLFDSLSTFVGVSEAANLLDKKGEPKNIKKALLVDAIATLSSSLFGTSAATTYIESSAGTEVGGRTGLTAIVTALCFLPFLFLAPLVSIIPSYATAPVLIIVGALMFRNIQKIHFKELEIAIPAIIVIFFIPLCFSITQGVLWGFLSYFLTHLLSGNIKQLHPLFIGLAVFSLIMIVCF